MTPISRKPHDAGSHDQQMTPAVQAAIDAADKRMPAGCTTPEGCRPHGCHGACLPGAAEEQIRQSLAAGPTPGRWMHLPGDRFVYDRMEDGCRGVPVVGVEYPPAFFDQQAKNLDYVAACNPANVSELLAELDGERNRSQMYADIVKSVAVVLHGEGYSDTSKLAHEVEALKADAERYRWLRDSYWNIVTHEDVWNAIEYCPRGADQLDAAIDAAKGGAE